MYGIIINEKSGNGKGEKVWRKLENHLKKLNVAYIYRKTERPGHGTILADELITKGITVIITVGGDGTIHEVANKLVLKNIPIGVVPAGSGNDFAKCHKIPTDYKKAFQRIQQRDVTKMDMIRYKDRYCLTIAGIGFDGEVAKLCHSESHKKSLKRFKLGALSYVIGILKVMNSYKPTTITIRLDHQTKVFSNAWLVAVANTPNYAGGIKMCPNAKCNDGILDICIVHDISKWELLRLLPKAYKGKHIMSEKVTILHSKEVHIDSDRAVIVQSDGESFDESPVRLQIVKNVLSVI